MWSGAVLNCIEISFIIIYDYFGIVLNLTKSTFVITKYFPVTVD